MGIWLMKILKKTTCNNKDGITFHNEVIISAKFADSMDLTNKTKRSYTVQEIESGLYNAVINFDPVSFIPYLVCDITKPDAATKSGFYNYFRMMVRSAKYRAKGEMHLVITNHKVLAEDNEWPFDGYQLYDFYDTEHKYSLLTFQVKKTEDEFYLNLLPF